MEDLLLILSQETELCLLHKEMPVLFSEDDLKAKKHWSPLSDIKLCLPSAAVVL